jgi:hypothetical protein
LEEFKDKTGEKKVDNATERDCRRTDNFGKRQKHFGQVLHRFEPICVNEVKPNISVICLTVLIEKILPNHLNIVRHLMLSYLKGIKAAEPFELVRD